MKKLSDLYKELGIDFTFPIVIKDSNDNSTYFEISDGYCRRIEYDENGREIHLETSDGYWRRKEYDENGKVTYYENSNGHWSCKVYDENGNQTYFENSAGYTRGTKRKSCDGKVITVDGKKYKLTEL